MERRTRRDESVAAHEAISRATDLLQQIKLRPLPLSLAKQRLALTQAVLDAGDFSHATALAKQLIDDLESAQKPPKLSRRRGPLGI